MLSSSTSTQRSKSALTDSTSLAASVDLEIIEEIIERHRHATSFPQIFRPYTDVLQEQCVKQACIKRFLPSTPEVHVKLTADMMQWDLADCGQCILQLPSQSRHNPRADVGRQMGYLEGYTFGQRPRVDFDFLRFKPAEGTPR